MNVLTPSRLIWQHSGSPAPSLPLEPITGYCATCGQPITEGLQIDKLGLVELSGGSDFFKFGTHLCGSCTWLYLNHRSQPHSFFATEISLLWPVVSAAVAERPTWQAVLSSFIHYSDDTPVAALLTTNSKPRVWPYARMSTRGNFRMYVNAPDYDIARMLSPDFGLLMELYSEIDDLMALGYTKRSILTGLYSARKVFNKDPKALQHERNIAKYRNDTSIKAHDTFLLALITAPKEAPKDG